MEVEYSINELNKLTQDWRSTKALQNKMHARLLADINPYHFNQ